MEGLGEGFGTAGVAARGGMELEQGTRKARGGQQQQQLGGADVRVYGSHARNR